MNPFYLFVLSAALLLGLMAMTVAWYLRGTSDALWAKVAVCVGIAALVCWVPLSVGELIGYPRIMTVKQLPEEFQLLGERSADDKTFDLWIMLPGEHTPLAIEVVPDQRMRKPLRDGEKRIEGGQMVTFRVRKGTGDGDNRQANDPDYDLVAPTQKWKEEN